MGNPVTRDELIKIVTQAAQPIAENFGRPLAYEGKDGRTDAAAAVTSIDRAVQAQLLQLLPGDFMGEEDGERVTGASQVWLTDPLDGTGARIRGLATATCIVTLMEVENGLGQPTLTVIHNPITKQTWSAEMGVGAFYQFCDTPETRCIINRHAPLPNKILSTITLWPGQDYRFDEVKKAVEADSSFDNQDFGALGAAHASVASGTSHLSACRASAAYETAAATLLMREADGIAWDLQGTPLMKTGFPIQDVRDKRTFTTPNGAVIASSLAVAARFLDIVHRPTL